MSGTWLLALYWFSTLQPVAFPGYQPATFPTKAACEEFRPHVDPKFITQCVPNENEGKG